MNAKELFLASFDREHAVTMRVLRAYPEDQLDLKPSPKSKSARELAWLFILESGLAIRIWNDELAKGMSGTAPKPPESWNELLASLESANQELRKIIAAATEEELEQKVNFYVAPKTLGERSRLEWIWFLLHDQIHHRGQLSVYLRMAGGKVPSIYGPTADEPWF